MVRVSTRPWALSWVRTEGGKAPVQRLQRVVETGLIALDREEVLPALLDNLLGGRCLGVQGVGGDHGALKRERTEKPLGDGVK